MCDTHDLWGRTHRLRPRFIFARAGASHHTPLPPSSLSSTSSATGAWRHALALEQPCRRRPSHPPEGVALGVRW